MRTTSFVILPGINLRRPKRQQTWAKLLQRRPALLLAYAPPLYGDPPDWENAGAIDYGAQGMSQGEQYAPPGSQYAETEAEARARLGRAQQQREREQASDDEDEDAKGGAKFRKERLGLSKPPPSGLGRVLRAVGQAVGRVLAATPAVPDSAPTAGPARPPLPPDEAAPMPAGLPAVPAPPVASAPLARRPAPAPRRPEPARNPLGGLGRVLQAVGQTVARAVADGPPAAPAARPFASFPLDPLVPVVPALDTAPVPPLPASLPPAPLPYRPAAPALGVPGPRRAGRPAPASPVAPLRPVRPRLPGADRPPAPWAANRWAVPLPDFGAGLFEVARPGQKHTVRGGETFAALELQYRLPPGTLSRYNPGLNPFYLPPGTRLNLDGRNLRLVLGKLGRSGEEEDFEFGFNAQPNTPEGKKLVDNFASLSDQKLLDQLQTDLRLGTATLFPALQAANKIVDHLAANTGKDLNLQGLVPLMESEETMQATQSKVSELFRQKMSVAKGDFARIQFTKGEVGLPNFEMTLLRGTTLLTLVGGTQQLDINLDAIKVTGRSYAATIDLILYDDFGVSANDFVKPSFPANFGQDGLTALWMLQHQRNYKPFRTVFRFRQIVHGTF